MSWTLTLAEFTTELLCYSFHTTVAVLSGTLLYVEDTVYIPLLWIRGQMYKYRTSDSAPPRQLTDQR